MNDISKNDEIHNYHRYLLCEYPCHLKTKKTTQTDKASPYDSDVSGERINSIRYSTVMYIVLLVILIIEFIMMLFLPLIIPGGIIHWPAIIIKLIGIGLCISSLHAWRQQLWKESEYYGWAVGNYSRDEPVYRMLMDRPFRIEDDEAIVVIGDWLKNRPSVIFLLTGSILCVYLHQVFVSIPSVRWFFIEIVLSVFVFLLSFIKTTTIRYFKTMPKDSRCSFLMNIIKTGFALYAVLFLLPIIIIFVFEGISEWWTMGILLLTAGVIYGLLLIGSLITIRGKRKTNREKIKEIRQIISERKLENGQSEKLINLYKELSCIGQMQILNDIEFQKTAQENADEIMSQLEENSHSVQVLNMVLQLY